MPPQAWEGGPVYALVELLTLWEACAALYRPVRKRRWGWGRAAALLGAGVCLNLAIPLLQPWRGGWLLGLPGLFTSLFFWVCADTKLPSAIYCGIWAQLIQQLVSGFFLLAGYYFSPTPAPGGAGWPAALALLAFTAGCVIVSFTIAQWMPVDGRYRIGPRQFLLALSLQVVFVLLYGFEMAGISRLGPLGSGLVLVLQCYCVTMLYFQYALFSRSAMRRELELLDHLWHKQEEQYRRAKELIAVVNQKCHDLKHQISAMRLMGAPEQRERYLQEIEEAVDAYGSIIHTGNEVLDTALNEKSLQCRQRGIQLGCIVDGQLLSFMDPVDMYAILGNAIDNAAEAVGRFPEEERRAIDVLICGERGFCVIQVSNAMEGELDFEDGLPRSTKPRDGYHGFGLKSIRSIARRYGGFLSVSAEGGRFTLKILIPLPAENGTDP